MSREISEQESFWAGDFGNEYIGRNTGADYVAANISFFARVFQRTAKPKSILELGSNIGNNIQALHALIPGCELRAVEINKSAFAEVSKLPYVTAWNGSLLDYRVESQVEMSFTKGVLIHLAPELLPQAYDKLYEASSRLVLVAEYYSPEPVEVPYRGHSEKLYKRDFAGDMLDRFPDLKLRDYGFVYRRDWEPMGDVTWFLMEKM